jgi:putative DNA primase/helicase
VNKKTVSILAAKRKKSAKRKKKGADGPDPTASSSRAKARKVQSSHRPASHRLFHCRPIGAPEVDGKKLPQVSSFVGDLALLTEVVLNNMLAANQPSPYLFRYGGLLAWLERADDESPFVRVLGENHLVQELARTMLWGVEKEDNKGNKKWVPGPPPIHVVKNTLATPNPPFPVLEAIVETPVFGRDGSLQLTTGYHAASRSYYLPEEKFAIPAIPARPSGGEMARARSLLMEELLGDFPFVSPADRAHAMAFALLPYVRNLIPGPTPLHLFEKPEPGTGATLLVNVLTRVSGRPLAAMSEGGDDEEYRKRITAKLRNGPSVILIDNVRRTLDSAALAAAITNTVWEDRILGLSVTARLPVRCAWAATANNPVLSTEISRRTIRIRLDAKTERPWLGREYRHSDLNGWVTANRSDLVWANLVLIQAWIAAGKPRGTQKLGMFEDWAEVMGGILEVAGIAGFLGNLNELYQPDAESEAFAAFVVDWFCQFKDQWVTANNLVPTAQSYLDLGGGTEQAEKIKLGKLLAQNRDRLFGPVRLERGEKYQGSNRYRLVSTKP